jgi:hypothetical protein
MKNLMWSGQTHNGLKALPLAVDLTSKEQSALKEPGTLLLKMVRP